MKYVLNVFFSMGFFLDDYSCITRTVNLSHSYQQCLMNEWFVVYLIVAEWLDYKSMSCFVFDTFDPVVIQFFKVRRRRILLLLKYKNPVIKSR